ncbi:MAG: hypothetical protein H5U16_00410 [Roseovarius sp.]|nr:hypothetical protein [Roseovarius sp.]
MNLQFVAHLRLSDPMLDQDLRDFGLVALPSGLHLVAGTGPQGGLVSYRLDAGGAAQLVDTRHFTGAAASGQTGLVTPVAGEGDITLAFGSAPDGAGQAILGLELDEAGGFGETVILGTLPQGGGDLSALVAVRVGGVDTLFAADGQSGRLLVFRSEAVETGSAPTGQAQDGAITLAGPALLSLAGAVGAGGHLLALDQGRGALHSLDVDPATGALTARDMLDAEDGLAIADATALEVVAAHGAHFAIIAAAGSQSLSVVRVQDDGTMVLVDHLLDTRATRFGGAQGLSVAQVGDHVLVVAGGADDGLSLFRLLPDGRLLHIGSLAHDIGLGLENVGQIGAAVVGTEMQIFVAGDPRGGISQFALDLSGLGLVAQTEGTAALLSGTAGDDLLVARGHGADTLEGGAGDDILVAGPGETELRGGPGRDIHVVSAQSRLVRITDFTPGLDRIDLSALPFLRNPGQLVVEAGLGFARLVFRDTVVEITATVPVWLDAAQLLGPAFDWPDRLPIITSATAPPATGSAGADVLSGTAGADSIDGLGGDDRIYGMGGDDTLRGGEGNDLLRGGSGDDSLFGGGGDDTLRGGMGDDTLEGGAGDDLLFGGPGHDLLLGGDGHDTLAAGFGEDVIHGGAGDDLILAAFGDDMVSGGSGNDTISLSFGDDLADGGAGDDLILGGLGRDTLFGGEGNDVLLGGWGDDLLDGGAGRDMLRGGTGRDTLIGGAGDDVLTGGWGADVFVFADGHGRDTITDFDPFDPLERIDLRAVGALGSLADVRAATTVLGEDLWIDTGGGDAIVLRGVTAGDLGADDFLF